MKILVQAKNMRVTRSIQSFVNDKVIGSIGKLGQKVIGVKVYIENINRKKSESNSSNAKVQIQVPGKDIVVKQESHDPYQAITGAIDAGSRQLRKLKEKKLSKKRNGHKS